MRISHLIRKFLTTNIEVKIVVVIAVYLLYFAGIFTILFETSFDHFDFPSAANVEYNVELLMAGEKPVAPPINIYNYSYIHENSQKCADSTQKLRLIYIVKSAAANFAKREAIRRSWGFEKRFSDVGIKTIFMLGVVDDNEVQMRIDTESKTKGDIVQANFVDDYYNNTIKMMMAINWAFTFCNEGKFYFFSDDDMYVSTKNVLRFIRNPLDYPGYLEKPVVALGSRHSEVKRHIGSQQKRKFEQILDFELPDDAELYAGYIFKSTRPHRHRSSKWYISLEEYPYNRWPPYATAGCFILSNVALRKFHYASMYIKHFRFDDIYISILAWKVRIIPVHNDEFYFYKKYYNVHSYQYVIASHGYDDTLELLRVWEEQKSAGNA